jgi:hypothetical protein
MCILSITREGEEVGATVSGPLINVISQTAAPFQFPYIILDSHVTFFYFQTSLPLYFILFSLMVAVCFMLMLVNLIT